MRESSTPIVCIGEPPVKGFAACDGGWDGDDYLRSDELHLRDFHHGAVRLTRSVDLDPLIVVRLIQELFEVSGLYHRSYREPIDEGFCHPEDEERRH